MKAIHALPKTKIVPLLTRLTAPRCLKSMSSSRLSNPGKLYSLASSTTRNVPRTSQLQNKRNSPLLSHRRQALTLNPNYYQSAPYGSIVASQASQLKYQQHQHQNTAMATSLPSARLLARAFHRNISTAGSTRLLSTTRSTQAWTGRQASENTVREKDSNNVQHDAVKEGKADRASSDASDGGNKSGATSEKDVKGSAAKAKEENPKAPGPIIGMNDERGGKGA